LEIGHFPNNATVALEVTVGIAFVPSPLGLILGLTIGSAALILMAFAIIIVINRRRRLRNARRI